MVLASASPRRKDLLRAAGLDFETRTSGFDETQLRHLRPMPQARAAARAKAEAVARLEPEAWVIGCDTVVAIDGEALGQPADAGDAWRMLRALRGRAHTVISAVCVLAPGGAAREGAGVSVVRIADLSDEEIAAYLDTGEAWDKAGAYGIQGAAGEFAALERGRVDTVIGLPLHVLRGLLRDLDAPVVC